MKNRRNAVKPMGMAGVGASAFCPAMPTTWMAAYSFTAEAGAQHRLIDAKRPLGPPGGRSG